MIFKKPSFIKPCYSLTTTPDQLPVVLKNIKNSRLIVGFISPNIDFHRTSAQIKSQCPTTTVILTTSAGEISSATVQSSVYLPTSDNWDSIVLHVFSSQMISSVSVASVNLHCQDIKAGNITLTYKERYARICQELNNITPPADINYRNGLALTYIDGLSGSESYFMEAIYESGKFPFLFIGGSAGGKLDFRQTWIFNNKEVIENHAVICFIRLTDHYCYSVFKSQNFEPTGHSFIIGECQSEKRIVHSVIDQHSGKSVSFIRALCATLHCSEAQLDDTLKNHTFAINLESEFFVRSILQIDYIRQEVYFACDLSFGEELLLMKSTAFNDSLASDYACFAQHKPTPVGGILTDCILRRLNNAEQLHNADTLKKLNISGFSSFGELLGIHINQTATAVFFYENKAFKNQFIDEFTIHYANYKSYFMKKQLNRLSIIDTMKNQIIVDLYQYQKFAEKLVEDMPVLSESAAQLFTEMDEIKNNTLQFSTVATNNTKNASRILNNIINLEKNIKNINGLLALVNNIADKTKLLSLNASIESARAGVYGKGFSVVAGEIRRLAHSAHENIATSSLAVNDILYEFKELSQGADLLNTIIHEIINYLTDTTDQLHSLSILSIDNKNKMDSLIKNMMEISVLLEGTRRLYSNIASSDSSLKLLAQKIR